MTVRRRKVAGPGLAKARARAKSLDLIGELGGKWQRPEKVFTTVRAVPTIFPAVDVAMGCGGLPLERYVLVHGPAGMGKSRIVQGFALSFLRAGHVAGFLEPEATSPIEWLEENGFDRNDPLFVASRPVTYEEAVDQTRKLLVRTKELREGKRPKLPPSTRAIVVVDAITKLAPEHLLEKLQAEGKAGGAEGAGVDGMNGGGGRYIAGLNSAWTRELTGLLYSTESTFVAVARERENQDPRSKRRWAVTGGRSLLYEASIALRVAFRKDVVIGGTVVGSKHLVDVMKLKVADDTVERVEAFFHTSNGEGDCPVGFDRARDVWELAKETGAVRHVKRGGKPFYESFEGELLTDDEEAQIATLRANEREREAMETEARRRGLERTKKGNSEDGERTEE